MEPSASPPRIAVVGAGAIGLSLAAGLMKADRAHVTLCARTPFDELVVDDGSGTFRGRPCVAARPDDVGVVDWVLLATKAHQTAGAAPWLSALVGPGTRVAVAQNGVEHEARVRPFVGDAAVLPVVVQHPAVRVGPGRVRRLGLVTLVVPDDEAGRSFRALFEGSDAHVACAADFTTAAWTKLCFNVTAAVAVLTDSPMGVVRRPDVADLARGLVEEAVRVGRAEGAHLDDSLAASVVDSIVRGRPDARPSIALDARERRPLEYDARNGAVVRAGARHGIPTPLSAAVTALLAALSDGYEARPPSS